MVRQLSMCAASEERFTASDGLTLAAKVSGWQSSHLRRTRSTCRRPRHLLRITTTAFYYHMSDQRGVFPARELLMALCIMLLLQVWGPPDGTPVLGLHGWLDNVSE